MWMKIKSGSAVYKAGGFYFKIGGDWGGRKPKKVRSRFAKPPSLAHLQ